MIYVILAIFVFAAIISYPTLHGMFFLDSQIIPINTLIDQRKINEAKKEIKRLPKVFKNDAEVLFANHRIEEAQKNYRMALYYLNEIESGHRYKPQKGISFKKVALEKIHILEQLGNKEEVVSTCKKILKNNPQDTAIMTKISELYFDMKNEGAAKPFLQEAIRQKSKNYEVYLMHSSICIKEKSFKTALNSIDKALRLYDGKSCRLMEKRIEILYSLAMYQEAISYDKQIDDTYRRLIKTQACIGLCFLNLGKEKEAVLIFEKLLNKHISDVSPPILEARYHYSELLTKEGNHKDAMEQLVMLNRSQKNFLDTSERITMYEKFFNMPELLEIVLQNNEKKIKPFFQTLIPRSEFLQDSFNNSAQQQICTFIVNKKGTALKGEYMYIILHYQALPLKTEMLENHIASLIVEFAIYSKPVLVKLYSFYEVPKEAEELIGHTLTKKVNTVTGSDFFTCIKNGSLFLYD